MTSSDWESDAAIRQVAIRRDSPGFAQVLSIKVTSRKGALLQEQLELEHTEPRRVTHRRADISSAGVHWSHLGFRGECQTENDAPPDIQL